MNIMLSTIISELTVHDNSTSLLHFSNSPSLDIAIFNRRLYFCHHFISQSFIQMVFIHNLLLILGRGIGQVMFQNNALSGLFMLIGIFLNSWQMGILAVCGNIISTLTAHFSI